jgi:sugar phosphate permease
VEWSGGSAAAGNLKTVFADARFWRIVPHNFFMAGTILAFQGLWAGPYLFDVLQLSNIQAGNVLLLLSIGATVGFTASGWLSDRLGLVRMVITSSVLFVICQLGLAARPPLEVVRLIYTVLGFTGGFNIMLLAHARHTFPPAITGQAVTAVNLFGIGGTFLLQWWLGLIVDAFPADAAGRYPPQTYTAALLFTAVGTGLALLWYLPMARQPNSETRRVNQ